MAKKSLILMAVAAGVASAVLSGCGGGDNTQTGLDNFRGNWTGTHRFYPANGGSFQDSGLMNLSISSGGSIEGTMTKSSTNESVAVFGTVTSRGTFALTWRFNGFGSDRTIEGPVVVLNGEFRPDNNESRLPTVSGAGGQLEFRLVRD
ncbi:MAG TPA: hypothetical protein PLO61_02195 [Fimbriimonadaceae bacterium]|nr:hypothetical protein [Fimbriimonadaceae bacterium]HRJ32339.1 hypothetical protein [Fimbriimonadaceae bacterium]